MKHLHISAILVALVFASCAPSTPDARIVARPELFEKIPTQQKELIRQGRIDKGMSTDAVYLAWGKASRVYEGSENNVPILRWDYTGATPVYHTNFYGGYGHGRYSHYGVGITPEVTYVPYRRATVLFRNGRVASWERTG
jgi:hypothetical protein